MPVEYIAFGEPCPDNTPTHLALPDAKRTLAACLTHRDFQVIELRRRALSDGAIADIIVVDCINDQVPSRNPYGIHVRERLALVFFQSTPPEVRTLRKDFPVSPVVPHQNHVPFGEPASLCLYFEPWSAIERTWTPQYHLRRILWWLSETARGSLHGSDQPVERIYFTSPYEIVLPSDYATKIKDESLSLVFSRIEQSTGTFRTIRGLFQPRAHLIVQGLPQIQVLQIQVSPIIHGHVEREPSILGQLHDQLEKRGGAFLDKLNERIREKTPVQGLAPNPNEHCLIVLFIPVKRTPEAEPERVEVRAFLILKDLATLGESVGSLTTLNGRYYAYSLIGGDDSRLSATWRNFDLSPVEIRLETDIKGAREASGISEQAASFRGVLLGVGALGSAVADLWSKEAWGTWCLIDHDTLEPHNIVRHLARNWHVGILKVDAVKDMMEANYPLGYYSVHTIPRKVVDLEDNNVKEAIVSSDLLIDATTTLEVPRDLARFGQAPRLASIFLTPSGRSSVLLMESFNRNVRLDSLEAQYYRAVINAPWGEEHLLGHGGMLWVGAGCRDVSVVMSHEGVQLHAATLARQIRIMRAKQNSCIMVWSSDSETGAVEVKNLLVCEQREIHAGDWRVVWDAGINEKLNAIRHAHLPNETGGVIVGFVDHKIRSIYIVDVLTAPSDSEADSTGFTRGVLGLRDVLSSISQRTANVVGYIGEWHSHPAFASAYPSSLDRALIEHLSQALALDGQPALMLIVGSASDISITVKGA